MEDVGIFILRLVVGGLFAGHGAQKLFGWFGGYGLKGTGGFMESIGLKPGVAMAALAGISELVGGLLLVAGFLVPVAALLIVAAMDVSIVKVHGQNGLWSQQGGYEYNLVLIAAVVALALVGPGAISAANALGVADVAVVGSIF